MNSRKIIILASIVFLVAVVGVVYVISRPSPALLIPQPQTATSTEAVFDKTIFAGVVTVSYQSAEWGVAARPDQVLVTSYVPPCDEGFQYCLYYIGSKYKGTNFESAGIRIQERKDLRSDASCLTAQPPGYTGLTPQVASTSTYSVSAFVPLGDAGAGHYAQGALYRLAFSGRCYEFETRIGELQFQNYPAGTIQEFTSADRTELLDTFDLILSKITLASGEHVVFPR